MADAADFRAERERLLAAVDATYADTAHLTGLAAPSPAVRAALGAVERHRLVPEAVRGAAYGNHPLPIGAGQTISQPYIVALSTDLLAPKPGDTMLDVGTGSGYQAAVLARLVARVVSIEIVPELAARARADLAALGVVNVEVHTGDGYLGVPAQAPYDGIVVAAAAPAVPPALVAQLKPGARMVIPLGREGEVQHLVVVTKRADGGHDERRVLPVRFVPLVPGTKTQ